MNNNHTWDLSALFKGDDDCQIEKEKTKILEAHKNFVDRWKQKEDYLENPEILLLALQDYESLHEKYAYGGDIGYYFSLRYAQDQNNPKIKAQHSLVIQFVVQQLSVMIQFFPLRLAKVRKDKQELFLNDSRLKKYAHYLQQLFKEAQHLLSEAEEKIMTMKSTISYSNWVNMTSKFLAQEERKVLLESGTYSTQPLPVIANLMNSQHKSIRDKAALAFNSIIKKYADVATEEINSILEDKRINDELRSYQRPDLSRHISDGIETEVVDTMLNSVEKKISIAHRYYSLKARLFGVKKLAYHERNVPYGNIDKKYSFDSAVKIIYRVMGRLDQEFVDIVDMFLSKGYIDVFPRKGKSGGAFCAHSLISQPTYILLNYTEKLQDVLTFAHELGHGINNELMRKKQPALYFSTPLATAEVASTFMEDFVLQYIEATSDPTLRLALLMLKLNDDISSIFRQVACYRFEQDLHQTFRQKGYLSRDEIGTLFQKHMSSYMGNAVIQSSGSKNWWVYWSHIRNFFYVYSYASGLLISKSLQASVKTEASFIKKVKEFLSSGDSQPPKEIFLKLGININDAVFWEKGLSEVEKSLCEAEELANQMSN